MKKRVIILGSTGSIGCSTLDVLSAMAEDWDVVGLAAGSRGQQLSDQANRFCPEVIAIADPSQASCLRDALTCDARVLAGDRALVTLVEDVDCDCVVAAVVGAQGLAATLRAAELGRRIALANKESLVVAGALLMALARENGAAILPVDSEHSAIFQALRAGRRSEVEQVWLTASGGPFRTWTLEQMEAATVEDALRHPTWEMGPKISIDSATMMNKSLEVVEARWLFGLAPEKIGVVVHPESIVHSMVEFCDGSVVAQMGAPDMRTPIQYALTYPQRRACPSRRLNVCELSQLTFELPDDERFPALRLGYEVAARGGTAGAVLNAANEVAVRLFQEGRIRFTEIARLAEQALMEHDPMEKPLLDDLLSADRWAREEVARCTAC